MSILPCQLTATYKVTGNFKKSQYKKGKLGELEECQAY